MGMNASMLDRRIQFRRNFPTQGPLGEAPDWQDYGSPVSASRKDVSDAEKFAAAQVQATVDSRFIVRATIFTKGITPIDRLICEGKTFNIIGIKQIGPRHLWLEISGTARTDQ